MYASSCTVIQRKSCSCVKLLTTGSVDYLESHGCDSSKETLLMKLSNVFVGPLSTIKFSYIQEKADIFKTLQLTPNQTRRFTTGSQEEEEGKYVILILGLTVSLSLDLITVLFTSSSFTSS